MIPPARDESYSGGPTPEMLAGIYLEIAAEEDCTIRPHKPPQTLADSVADGVKCPTVDQLAGIYLPVEAHEDLTVYPRAPVK